MSKFKDSSDNSSMAKTAVLFAPFKALSLVAPSFHRRMISVGDRPLFFKVINFAAQVIGSCFFRMLPAADSLAFSKAIVDGSVAAIPSRQVTPNIEW